MFQQPPVDGALNNGFAFDAGESHTQKNRTFDGWGGVSPGHIYNGIHEFAAQFPEPFFQLFLT